MNYTPLPPVEEVTQHFSRSLVVEEKYTTRVYKVRCGSELFVLKFSSDPIFKPRISLEGEALELIKGLRTVPKLIDRFEDGELTAILKSHMAGEVLKEYSYTTNNFGDKCMLPIRKEEALQTVITIHARGVSALDLHCGNVLIHNGQINLFDFDSCILSDRTASEIFEEEKIVDFLRLNELLKISL